MLIRHSTCFILYIITVTTFYVAFGYYTFYPTQDNYKVAASIGIFFNAGSCVSQILLVNIFWGLGTKIQRNQNDVQPTRASGRRMSVLESFVSVSEEVFDEDAEL
jgi:hypothetical protein